MTYWVGLKGDAIGNTDRVGVGKGFIAASDRMRRGVDSIGNADRISAAGDRLGSSGSREIKH
ncbi:hypothetical protein DPMN_010058 [Dreissena polymorpha]|uniref:Uncharacterized protein n=1 Tax=Dreissena polymorpha TaxID=45954 RepID=A0A9D4MY37_DREPO|nr:hypothetical protein DPMN_010058 [Dreissena polymorpha]